MKTAILVPAYGRDYSNAESVIAAFDSNMDFLIKNIDDRWRNKPCNKSDLQKFSDYTHAEIRYAKREKAIILKVNGD